MIPLSHYLIVSAALFSIGIFGVLSRRNILGVLMGIELMFNAANINLVAFSRYLTPGQYEGHIFAIVTITIAAAEAVVGLALVLSIYRNIREVYTEKMNVMSG